MAVDLTMIKFGDEGETIEEIAIEAWNVAAEEEKGIYIALPDEEKAGVGIHITKAQLAQIGYVEG